jgi:uncharacterized protein YeaO (DUF488 family)
VPTEWQQHIAINADNYKNRAGSAAHPYHPLRGHMASSTPDVRVKRIYDPADDSDGCRVLIDHVWPRGVTRERAALDCWAKELAPSSELRKWFAHVPERFPEFRSRYLQELEKHGDRIDDLHRRASAGALTILYAARDREHNNAIVLAEMVRRRSDVGSPRQSPRSQ